LTPQYRSIWVVVAVMALCAVSAKSQLLEHPYTTSAQVEALASEYASQGMVRRAHALLRSIRASASHTTADVVPFTTSAVERASGNAASADRAMEGFARTRRNAPAVPIAWMERALAAVEMGNDEASIPLFRNAAATASAEGNRRSDTMYRVLAHTALFWQGASMARTGRHAEALAVFQQAVDAYGSGPYADHALYAMGQLYERTRQFDSAGAMFGRIRREYPSGPVAIAARIREAQIHVVLRKPERAADALTGIDSLLARHERSDTMTLAPQRFATDGAKYVAMLRIDIAMLRGIYAEAYQRSGDFLARYSASPLRNHVHLQAGQAALWLGKADEAIGHYDVILDSIAEGTSSLRQQALLYRGVALRAAGRSKDANEVFAALALMPDYPYAAQAMVELGQAAYESEDYAKARTWLEKADKASVDAITTVRAQLLLGAALIELQQWPKAAEVYARAEQRVQSADRAHVPNRDVYLAESRLKRGIALVQSQQTQSAIVALTDFLGNHPADARRDEATFWLAEAMYRADNLRNAQELYEEVLQRYTASLRREEAFYGLAWTYFRNRDFDRSTSTFGQLLKNYPSTRYGVEAQARRGDGFYIKQQWKSAVEAYEDAARRGGKTEDGQYAAYQAAQAAYRGGFLGEAKRLAKAFVQNYPSSKLADAAFYLIGWVDFQQDHYEEAIKEFRHLLDLYPTGDMAVRALYTTADAQFNLGNVDEAMDTYRAVMHRFPSHPLAAEAAKSMQIALLGLNRIDEALAVADTFMSANPLSSAAEAFAWRKAEIFYSGKNYTSAAAELQAYMQRYPSAERQDEALYLLGKTYLNARDMVQARAAFSELSKRFPRSAYVPQGMLDLAIALFESADRRAADSLYRLVIERFPNDTASASRAAFERGVILRVGGDTASAMAQFLDASDRYADTEFGDQARFQVAQHYRKQRNVDSARFHFEILGTRSDAPLLAAHALYLAGEMDVRDKRYERAAGYFDKVRNDYAGYEDWYTLSMLGLGECHEQLGNKATALEVYGVVASLRPDDDYGKAAMARVKRLERRR
jgi:TolA-binding protein